MAARFAKVVAVTFPGTQLPKALLGMPMRKAITGLDRAAGRASARTDFGLDADRPVLLVSGGSQGRGRSTTPLRRARRAVAAGIDVLHVLGPKNLTDRHVEVVDQTTGARYVPVGYVDAMERAYAAADLMVARSGAGTVMETASVGLPCIFVPLPHGNGEQARNADFLLAADAARLVPNAELTRERLLAEVLPLIQDRACLASMSATLTGLVPADAAGDLARAVLDSIPGAS